MSTLRRSRSGIRRRPAATGGLGTRFAIARIVTLVGTVVALILLAGILLTVLGANHSNEVVKAVHDSARGLAGPFDGLFKLHSHRAQVAVDWGLAAVVYFAISRLVARAVAR